MDTATDTPPRRRHAAPPNEPTSITAIDVLVALNDLDRVAEWHSLSTVAAEVARNTGQEDSADAVRATRDGVRVLAGLDLATIRATHPSHARITDAGRRLLRGLA